MVCEYMVLLAPVILALGYKTQQEIFQTMSLDAFLLPVHLMSIYPCWSDFDTIVSVDS